MIGVQKRITMELILASWNVFQFACLVFFSKFYPVLLEIEQDSITQINFLFSSQICEPRTNHKRIKMNE